MENALLMKLSNDVEKYEIEVTKMGQNYSLFFTVFAHAACSLCAAPLLWAQWLSGKSICLVFRRFWV